MTIRATITVEWEPNLNDYDEGITNENQVANQEQKDLDSGSTTVEDLLELVDQENIKVTLEVI
jgi:hypothetical protein